MESASACGLFMKYNSSKEDATLLYSDFSNYLLKQMPVDQRTGEIDNKKFVSLLLGDVRELSGSSKKDAAQQLDKMANNDGKYNEKDIDFLNAKALQINPGYLEDENRKTMSGSKSITKKEAITSLYAQILFETAAAKIVKFFNMAQKNIIDGRKIEQTEKFKQFVDYGISQDDFCKAYGKKD
ncbi:MAG: hypothetical protein V4691_10175 [Pseudomonadota bacterium]